METQPPLHWRIYGRRDSALIAPRAFFTRTSQKPVLDQETGRPREFLSLEEAVAVRDQLNRKKPPDVARFVVYRYSPGTKRVEEPE